MLKIKQIKFMEKLECKRENIIILGKYIHLTTNCIFDEKNYRIQILIKTLYLKKLPKLNYNYNAAYTLNYSNGIIKSNVCIR